MNPEKQKAGKEAHYEFYARNLIEELQEKWPKFKQKDYKISDLAKEQDISALIADHVNFDSPEAVFALSKFLMDENLTPETFIDKYLKYKN